MTDLVNAADLKYGDCAHCHQPGLLGPSGLCPWCEEGIASLGEKWRAVRQRVQDEQEEAIYRRLNERFYTRLSELGITPPIGPDGGTQGKTCASERA